MKFDPADAAVGVNLQGAQLGHGEIGQEIGVAHAVAIGVARPAGGEDILDIGQPVQIGVMEDGKLVVGGQEEVKLKAGGTVIGRELERLKRVFTRQIGRSAMAPDDRVGNGRRLSGNGCDKGRSQD